MILHLFGARESFRRAVYELLHTSPDCVVRRTQNVFDVGLPSGDVFRAMLVESEEDLQKIKGLHVSLILEDDSFRAAGLRVDSVIVR